MSSGSTCITLSLTLWASATLALFHFLPYSVNIFDSGPLHSGHAIPFTWNPSPASPRNIHKSFRSQIKCDLHWKISLDIIV